MRSAQRHRDGGSPRIRRHTRLRPNRAAARLAAVTASALLGVTLLGVMVAAVPGASAQVLPAQVTGQQSVTTASRPSAPQRLSVPTLSPDADSISLTWSKPATYDDIVDYHVYRDGRLIGRAQDSPGSTAAPLLNAFYADSSNAQQYRVVPHHYVAEGLTPATAYTFTVRSVDAAGVESLDSTPVTASTTPVAPVFDVTAYGAIGDGTTLNTAAIQAAIDAATPGAIVRIPAGTFKTGSIWLKSDLTLDVAKGATLLGSDNPADYPWGLRMLRYSTELKFQALINAQTYTPGGLRNIRIVGEGTIDGNGWLQEGVDADGFRVAKPSSSGTVSTNGVLAKAQVARATEMGIKAPYPTRSNLILLRGVTNAYYGGFTATNPANHTLVNVNSTNVTVEGVRMETFSDKSGTSGGNADGIEFVNSTGLRVFDSVFDMGDDAVNLNAGIGAEAVKDGPTSDVWVFDNYFRNGHGAIVAGSFTGAWIQDVLAEDNVITLGDVALRMKTAPPNGGGARRVLFRDSAVKHVALQAFVFTSAYSDSNAVIAYEPAPVKARFEDVTVRNVTVDGTGGPAIGVIGIPDRPHQKLRFDRVRFINALPTSIAYLKASSFTDVTFDNTPDPWVITHSTSLRFSGSTAPTPTTLDASSAPTWPRASALEVTPTATSATLRWTAATDDTAVSAYVVSVNGEVVATVPGTQLAYQVDGLSPALRTTFTVRAQDATGNETDGPTATATTTGSPDAVAPEPPAGPGAVTVATADIGTTWTRVSWLAATDAVALKGYDVYLNGKRVATPPAGTTTATLTGLTAGTTYVVTVRAVDGSGNTARYPSSVTFTTLPAVVIGPIPR